MMSLDEEKGEITHFSSSDEIEIHARGKLVGRYLIKYLCINKFFEALTLSCSGSSIIELEQPHFVVETVCQHIMDETTVSYLRKKLEKRYTTKKVTEIINYFLLDDVKIPEIIFGREIVISYENTNGFHNGRVYNGNYNYCILLDNKKYITQDKCKNITKYAYKIHNEKIIIDNKIWYKTNLPETNAYVYLKEEELLRSNSGILYIPMELFVTYDNRLSRIFRSFFNIDNDD